MFLLLLITKATASCISSIGNLLADTLTDPLLELKQLTPYLYYSGMGINDFGLYEDCISQHQYAVIQFFVPSTPASVNMGICFTRDCPIPEINKSIMALKKLLMPAAQYIFQVDLADYELIILDTERQRQPTQSTYYFLIFLIIFILIQGIVTLKHQLIISQKQQQPQIQPQEIIEDIQQVSTYLDEEEYLIDRRQKQQNHNSNMVYNNCNQDHYQSEFFNLDIITNINQLYPPSKSKFEVLNGIRVLGFLMCVFGNTGISMLIQCDFLQVQHYGKHYILLIVFGCLYSVEIFLWLSGFFAVLSLNKINCIKGVFYRIIKIWPLMMIIILIHTQIIPYLYEGPRWFYIDRYTKCGKWWQNILFMNNFDDENYCTLWLWQLSLDVQLFIVCALLLVIYKQNKLIAVIATIILFIASQSYVIFICIKKEYGIPYFAAFTTDIYKSFYYRPWFRAPPYFVGMLTAFFYLNYKGNLQRWCQHVMLISGIVIISYLTFGWYDTMQFGQNYYSKLYSQIYEGTMRTIYGLGITLVALPNILGNSNIFYKAFNYTPIRYIVKFTFSGYLIHMFVIEVVIASFYRSIDFNVQSIAQVYMGCILITGFLAFFFRLLFELPMQITHKSVPNQDCEQQLNLQQTSKKGFEF